MKLHVRGAGANHASKTIWGWRPCGHICLENRINRGCLSFLQIFEDYFVLLDDSNKNNQNSNPDIEERLRAPEDWTPRDGEVTGSGQQLRWVSLQGGQVRKGVVTNGGRGGQPMGG